MFSNIVLFICCVFTGGALMFQVLTHRLHIDALINLHKQAELMESSCAAQK